MERFQNIFKNVLLEMKKLTNFSAAVDENCETQKDKEALKEYISIIALNTLCCKAFVETNDVKSFGFKNVSDMQSFIYVYMFNNPEINNI